MSNKYENYLDYMQKIDDYFKAGSKTGFWIFLTYTFFALFIDILIVSFLPTPPEVLNKDFAFYMTGLISGAVIFVSFAIVLLFANTKFSRDLKESYEIVYTFKKHIWEQKKIPESCYPEDTEDKWKKYKYLKEKTSIINWLYFGSKASKTILVFTIFVLLNIIYDIYQLCVGHIPKSGGPDSIGVIVLVIAFGLFFVSLLMLLFRGSEYDEKQSELEKELKNHFLEIENE